MNLEEVGKRVKLCRKSQKLTQEEFAEKINVSPHYVYEIERGLKTMSLPILGKVSETLNVSADFLLFGERPDTSLPSDSLDLLIDSLSSKNRIAVAKILETLLPYLK